jgi:hypothetical protein
VYLVAPSVLVAAESITIPAGTYVGLRTIEDIHPRNYKIGDRILLEVVSAVKVEGKIVIATGAIARGEITTSKKKGMAGTNAALGFSVKYVEAVDGTQVSLFGTKYVEGQSKTAQSVIFTILCCVLFLLQEGEDASVPVGTLIDTEIAGSVTISIE